VDPFQNGFCESVKQHYVEIQIFVPIAQDTDRIVVRSNAVSFQETVSWANALQMLAFIRSSRGFLDANHRNFALLFSGKSIT